jgi:CRP/FNR family cyclic AMP-dependent transcriptional regulator
VTLGELAVFTGDGRSATVTTCGDVIATVIRQADFVNFVSRRPHVAAQITATVGRRLRWANERRSDFAFPVHIRLGRVLLEIATSCGEAVGDGVLIGVELSQTELASLVGARKHRTASAAHAAEAGPVKHRLPPDHRAPRGCPARVDRTRRVALSSRHRHLGGRPVVTG